MLNRSIVIVKAKEPFLDWAESLPIPAPKSKITLNDINVDSSTYLLPEFEMDGEKEKILASYYESIFEEELSAWWTDQTYWPKSRSLVTFIKWFDIEFHSVIYDLVDQPLIDD